MTLLMIAIGGAAGTVTRYAVQTWVLELSGGRWPWGTLAVNLSGSFVLGLVFALSVDRAILPEELRLPLMVGFLGAYTTFSTLMLESWRLVEEGSLVPALLNIVGSSILGLVAVVAGLALGRALA
jgi:CrcB protein